MNNDYYQANSNPGSSYPLLQKNDYSKLKIIIPLMAFITKFTVTGLNLILPTVTSLLEVHNEAAYGDLFTRYLSSSVSSLISTLLELLLIFGIAYKITKCFSDAFSFAGCYAVASAIGFIIREILQIVILVILIATNSSNITFFTTSLSITGFIQTVISIVATALLTSLTIKKLNK